MLVVLVGTKLLFDFEAWDDDQLKDAYEAWFMGWMHRLTASQRSAFLLLCFGAAVGPALQRRTDLIPSAAARPVFLPEASQIVLPAAGSQEEFAERMSASILLAPAPPIG